MAPFFFAMVVGSPQPATFAQPLQEKCDDHPHHHRIDLGTKVWLLPCRGRQRLVHVSGTTGTDHATGQIPDSVTEQCELALRIIGDALARAGASFADVVRVHYILADREDFPPCWPILAETFAANPPAATMIEAGLIDARHKIEIEVTAVLPSA